MFDKFRQMFAGGLGRKETKRLQKAEDPVKSMAASAKADAAASKVDPAKALAVRIAAHRAALEEKARRAIAGTSDRNPCKKYVTAKQRKSRRKNQRKMHRIPACRPVY